MSANARIWLSVFAVCMTISYAQASAGDRSQFFINCLRGCQYSNCTEGKKVHGWEPAVDFVRFDAFYWRTCLNVFSDGERFQEHIKPDYVHTILLWSCQDECIYHCMWRTTNSFISRQWKVPQFYGKWPFKRFFGIQEPASALFSLLNFLAHWNMIKMFRREVRSDSPMYYIWHIFCAVRLPASSQTLWINFYSGFCLLNFICCFQICINGWMFSIIFHTRDFPLTELLDYSFAFSMVLASFCCMILR